MITERTFWEGMEDVRRTGKIRSSDTKSCVLFLKCTRDRCAALEGNKYIQHLELLVVKFLAIYRLLYTSVTTQMQQSFMVLINSYGPFVI